MTIAGALALHISAGTSTHPSVPSFSKDSHVDTPAIISYLASFVLVKYSRVSAPDSEEGAIGSPGREETVSTPRGTVKGPQSVPTINLQSLGQQPVTRTLDPIVIIERVYLRNLLRTKPSASIQMFSASSSKPETVTAPELQDAYNVLWRCNSVCVILTFAGFLLAITGIMAYVWSTFALAPGIFVSVCFIVSLAAACYALR
jgi:hypothetical protein